MLKGEDEETADTDIDSIMRAIQNELSAIGLDRPHIHEEEDIDDDAKR
jgi:hypothetical protein